MRIILGFIFIFMLIFGGYQIIKNLDDEQLEKITNLIPTIVGCLAVTGIVIGFIVVNF